MKFEPNFEQFKKDEKRIERILTVNPEVHFGIDDISKKVINSTSLSKEDVELLEVIFNELQDLDRDIINSLDNYRSSIIISREEFLICSIIFLISLQVGPDIKNIREAFSRRIMKKEDFKNILELSQLPKNTKLILENVYLKIINPNNLS